MSGFYMLLLKFWGSVVGLGFEEKVININSVCFFCLFICIVYYIKGVI